MIPFQFYCKGIITFAPDSPRFTSGKGVEPLGIPRGFPLTLPFKSILQADAQPDESVDVVLEYDQEGPVLQKLEERLHQPVMRGANYYWVKQDIPGADQLSAEVDVKAHTVKIHYFSSHLVD